VSPCTLNQWCLSFEQNKQNIIKSIEIAKAAGATYRLGPELEISGYGCEDHFSEMDTIRHSWEALADILKIKHLTQDIIVDIGMIVFFKNTFYNCRIMCLN
jgi:NAD+ synthase (glutamine-hydrolysing)